MNIINLTQGKTMNIINLTQGTPEWHAHRRNHFNASDAPAMLNESPYKSRARLLKECAIGITEDIDEATQARFDQGHTFEALARQKLETQLGEDLYPCVAVLDKYSASFDGMTMTEDLIFEHKTLNDSIRNTANAEELPLHYRIQMEQQLMISGATVCLFVGSKWDGEECTEWKQFEYKTDTALRQRIIDGWAQFEKDLQSYEHVEIIEPEKKVVRDLPMVSVRVTGELVACNLADVKPVFDQFLMNALKNPQNDDEFAQVEAESKIARAAAKKCLDVKQQILSQMLSISEVTRTLDEYAEKFNALGLLQEKAYKQGRDAKKAEAKAFREGNYKKHIDALNSELAPCYLVLTEEQKPDFIGAMKNQRLLSSLYEKLDAELSRAKIEADSAARLIRANLSALDQYASEYRFLFNDLQSIITKPADDFENVVKMRVSEHQQAEAKRIEAEREKIRAEEQAKAEREAQAKLSAQQAQAPQPEQVTQPTQIIVPVTAKTEQMGEATLTIGMINERLGFVVNAEFLAQLGFEPEQVGKFKKYHEHDFVEMCARIVRHVYNIQQGFVKA